LTLTKAISDEEHPVGIAPVPHLNKSLKPDLTKNFSNRDSHRNIDYKIREFYFLVFICKLIFLENLA